MIFGPLLVLVVLFARGGLLGLATQLVTRSQEMTEPQP